MGQEWPIHPRITTAYGERPCECDDPEVYTEGNNLSTLRQPILGLGKAF